MQPPKINNCTAAAIAAAAISEVFPGSELFGGGETDTGFFYQFFYPHSLPPEAPKILEERMRQIVKEGRPVRAREMVAFSAAEMFRKEGHVAAVEMLSDFEPKEIVSVVEVGAFHDLAEGPFCKEVGVFQITGFHFLGEDEVRIEGTAFPTKEQLKEYLRKLAAYEKRNYITIGQELKYWKEIDGELVWLEKGLRAKDEIGALLRKFLKGEEVSGPRTLADKYCLARVPFTAIDTQPNFQLSLYCSKGDLKNFSNYLLQSVEKTLTILGFPSSDWTVEDDLGRKHVLFTMEREEVEGKMILRLEADVERMLFLLLEIKGGTDEMNRILALENQ